MKKYIVTGNYTISFEMEVEADSLEEAEEMGYDLDIKTEWNGNSVFVDSGEAELNADGDIFNVEVEQIDEDEESEEE